MLHLHTKLHEVVNQQANMVFTVLASNLLLSLHIAAGKLSLFIAIPLAYLHNKSCSSKLRRMQSAQTFLMSCDRICQMVNKYSELRWIRIEDCHLKRKQSDKQIFSIGQSEKCLNTTSGLVCRFMQTQLLQYLCTICTCSVSL